MTSVSGTYIVKTWLEAFVPWLEPEMQNRQTNLIYFLQDLTYVCTYEMQLAFEIAATHKKLLLGHIQRRK